MDNAYITLPLGRLEANCYIVDCGSVAAIIDPGDCAERIIGELERLGLPAGAVLITHGHFDHVGAARALNEKYACPVWRSKKDDDLPPVLANDAFYTDCYADGDAVTVGNCRFEVIETPGHSKGSVCLKCGGMIFTGDTLFRGSCGRVDLPGGCLSEMNASLARLASLPGDPVVLPGHGEATTLEYERAHNAFMPRAHARRQ